MSRSVPAERGRVRDRLMSHYLVSALERTPIIGPIFGRGHDNMQPLPIIPEFKTEPGTPARVAEVVLRIGGEDPDMLRAYAHPALALEEALQPFCELDDEAIKQLLGGGQLRDSERLTMVRTSMDYTAMGIDARGALDLPSVLFVGRAIDNAVSGRPSEFTKGPFRGMNIDKIDEALERQRRDVIKPIYLSAEPPIQSDIGLEVLATYLPLSHCVCTSDAYPTLTEKELRDLFSMAREFILNGQKPLVDRSRWAIGINDALPQRLKLLRAEVLNELAVEYHTIGLQNATSKVRLKPEHKRGREEQRAIYREDSLHSAIRILEESTGLLSYASWGPASEVLQRVDPIVSQNAGSRDLRLRLNYGMFKKPGTST